MKISLSSNSSIDFNSSEANAGCLSGLVHRLLCRNFNHPRLDTREQLVKEEKKKRLPNNSPGLVARLMGLESMPVYPYTPTETFVRSRSTNSIEGWNGFLSGQKSWTPKHRTSHSFREEPTFLRKENEDFLLLSFTPDDKGEEREPETKSGGIERPNVGKENEKPVQKKELCRKPRKRVNGESWNGGMKQTEEPKRLISKKKRSVCAVKRAEIECSSQNSSPVSVLDSEYLLGPDSPTSGNIEEEKKPTRKREKPRRKLSSELKTDSYPSPKTELKVIRDSNRGESIERKEPNFPNIWGQICIFAEEDVKRSCWNFRDIWRLEDSEETAAVIELELLNLLLSEVLTELSTCSLII